jgi:hypothetical protein
VPCVMRWQVTVPTAVVAALFEEPWRGVLAVGGSRLVISAVWLHHTWLAHRDRHSLLLVVSVYCQAYECLAG